MLKIGLTGGIGSGKTTVAAIFESLGIPVYYADNEAKRLMTEDPEIVKAIQLEFGENSYSEHRLNTSFIAQCIYQSPSKRQALDRIVHPATIAHANSWMKSQQSKYCIKEAALIFESQSNKSLDYIIGVSAPIDMRIERVMKRNQIEKEKVQAIIESQMNEDEKMKRCDFIILNDDSTFILPQVLNIHQELLSKYTKK